MREIGSGRRKEGRQKEMTPYIVVFMISIGLFALSDRVKYTQRKPIVFISVMALCLLAGMRAVGVGTDTRVYLMPVYEAAKRSHSIGEYLNSSFHAFTWTTDYVKDTPFLIIGCVYLTLGTFMATSYTVHKDSFGYLFSGSFGAAFNILLNFILIPVIGVYGAALATCISYIAVFMFRVFHTRKYIKYDIMYKEFILGSLLMLVSAILMFVDGMKGFLLQLVILLIGFTVFSKTWIPMLQFFLNKIQRKRVS